MMEDNKQSTLRRFIVTNDDKTYKAIIAERDELRLGVVIQHFVIVKAKDIENALSNIIDHLNTDILRRKYADFNFEKLDMKHNCFWDAYFRDLSQGIQINLKDITNDAFKYICVKYV